MAQHLSSIAFLVRDYDEAIEYFTKVLDFRLVEDTVLSETKRWVVVAPKGKSGSSLVLAKAATPEQKKTIGNQTAGRVFLFLHTENFLRDFEQMKSRGVHFREEPRTEPYGTVAVFDDLYGNKWDLVGS
ncbi:MAG: VOC family protein [Bacteroidota bacterium]